MLGYLGLLKEQLTSRGWPSGLITTITEHVTGDDLVGVGIRLALMGVCASTVKSLLEELYERGSNALFPTAYIGATDPAYGWVGTYLSQEPLVVKQMQSFRLQTSDERDSQRAEVWRHSKAARQDGLVLSKKVATWTSDSVVGQLIPVHGQHLKIIFHGVPLWVSRQTVGFEGDLHAAAPHFQIRTYAWHAETIKDFVLASHKLYYQKEEGELMIHHASWFTPITRPARAWFSVFLPRHIKEDLLADVKGFLSDEEKQWYATRGIPHRRGYLLHGPPGSGKTTLATAIASHLRLDLYCINPATRGMDDNKVQMLFRDVPSGSLILIEDIDCVMPARTRKKHDADSDSDENVPVAVKPVDPGRYGLPPSTVTLSGLLNAIDGVASQEDSVLLASTNHPERLDDALRRPGRFDVHARFDDAESSQVIALFKHFYPHVPAHSDHPHLGEKKAHPSFTAGYSFEDESEQAILAAALSTAISESGAKVSMAALQGHLLNFKKDPKQAVERAAAWAAGLYEEQESQRIRKEARRRHRQGQNLANGKMTPQGPADGSHLDLDVRTQPHSV